MEKQKRNSFIDYKEFVKRSYVKERLEEQNRLIYKKSYFKIGLGCLLCGVGIITLPLPTGSIILISVGCGLIINGGIDLLGKYRKIKSKLLNKLRLWGLIR